MAEHAANKRHTRRPSDQRHPTVLAVGALRDVQKSTRSGRAVRSGCRRRRLGQTGGVATG